MVQRTRTKSHNEVGINDHPARLSERGLRVLRGLRKRCRFSYAASVELNSVAPLSRSQRKRDRISFEHNLFLTRIHREMSSSSLKRPTAFCLPMHVGTKDSQVAPPRRTFHSTQDSQASFVLQAREKQRSEVRLSPAYQVRGRTMGLSPQFERVQRAPRERPARPE